MIPTRLIRLRQRIFTYHMLLPKGGESSIQVLADNNSYGPTTCVDHANTTFPNST